MKIESWQHRHVQANDAVQSGGNVNVLPRLISSDKEGCTLAACKCAKSLWISLNLGLQKNGCVYGITYHFDNHQQQSDFINYN